MRTCTHCHKSKPLSAYHRCTRGRGGLASYCADCDRKAHIEWRTRNRDRALQLAREGMRRKRLGIVTKCNCRNYARCMVCRNAEKRRAWKAGEIPAYRLAVILQEVTA